MQPYRVEAIDSHKNTHVISAMLSKGKISPYHIYIVEKHFKSELDNLMIDSIVKDSSTELAHAMSTRTNSTIKVRYDFESQPGRRKYKLIRSSDNFHIDKLDYTLQDCLRTAMVDYCTHKNLNIVRYL